MAWNICEPPFKKKKTVHISPQWAWYLMIKITFKTKQKENMLVPLDPRLCLELVTPPRLFYSVTPLLLALTNMDLCSKNCQNTFSYHLNSSKYSDPAPCKLAKWVGIIFSVHCSTAFARVNFQGQGKLCCLNGFRVILLSWGWIWCGRDFFCVFLTCIRKGHSLVN